MKRIFRVLMSTDTTVEHRGCNISQSDRDEPHTVGRENRSALNCSVVLLPSSAKPEWQVNLEQADLKARDRSCETAYGERSNLRITRKIVPPLDKFDRGGAAQIEAVTSKRRPVRPADWLRRSLPQGTACPCAYRSWVPPWRYAARKPGPPVYLNSYRTR